jgi:hypothetical protein
MRIIPGDQGAVECPPFGDYVLDPNSVFMSSTCGKRDTGRAVVGRRVVSSEASAKE